MRLIDADALISDIERTIGESGCVNHEGEIMDCVRYAPIIEAVPVVHGKWIRMDETHPETGLNTHYCSICDYEIDGLEPYCPNCGAKMDKESESNGE